MAAPSMCPERASARKTTRRIFGWGDTPEGKSIVSVVSLPPATYGSGVGVPRDAVVIPFSAQSRMSGIDLPDGRRLRKGA